MATVIANDSIQAQEREDVDILAEKCALDTTEATSRAPSTRAASLKNVNTPAEANGSPEPKVLESASSSKLPSTTGTIQIPFPHPLPQCKPTPRPPLTPDQQKKYDELLKLVESWTEIPKTSHKHAEKEPLTDDDRLWLTRECLLRYLRATSWHSVDAAAKRLLHTLTWRREYGLHMFTPEYISPENETGKQVIFGYDNEARPCLYMNPAKQNTAKSEKQLHHLVYMLERVIDLMVPGQETTALVINFKNSSSGHNPSVGQGRQTLNILQGHYPERLGRALISELPWYVTTFFKLISPFIDPVTKTKMKFNEPLVDHVPPEQLQKDYGGNADFEYNHDIYWPALATLCERRRNDYRARWEKAGKKIGEHEAFLRGGEVKCLSGEFLGSEFPEGFSAGDETGAVEAVDPVEEVTEATEALKVEA